MAWTLRFEPAFEKDLRKLDREVQRRVVAFLEKKIAPLPDPRVFGKALGYDLIGHWRYRMGDYRIICRLDDDKLVIVGVAIGHRSIIYDR